MISSLLAPSTTDGPLPSAATTSFAAGDSVAAFQRRLARRNERRLAPALPSSWEESGRQQFMAADLAQEADDRLLEDAFVVDERRAVAPLLREAPTEPQSFLRWFEDLRVTGPGQNDPLFPFLAEHARLNEMRWFLGQEVAGEAGFDDLLALAQLRMPPGVKMEMARNYWDEMGRGHEAGVHGMLLDRLTSGLQARLPADEIVWESRALSNLMLALAWNRPYAYQAIGALGVIELTAPGRAAQVNAGLRRLQVPGAQRRYFALHATLDLQHSATWNRQVLLPLAAQGPDIARAMAEGALLRLTAGARCFRRYREALGVGRAQASAPAA